MERNSKKDLMVTLAVLLVICFIVAGVVLTKKKPVNESSQTPVATTSTTSSNDTATPAETTITETPATDAAASTPANASGYKDGDYRATGNYSTSETTETITVNVTLKDGVVTGTSATASKIARESKEYAEMFLQNYKSQVVGKKITDIKLSRVSGSSLTSQGFNSAIQTIEAQAKSAS